MGTLETASSSNVGTNGAKVVGRAPRVAILGGGAVTRIFYVPLLSGKAPALDLRAVVEPGQSTWQRLPALESKVALHKTAFQEYFARLEPGEIDAVIVALPHHLHEAAVVAAASKGLHVFCEKPLGLDAQSVMAMQAAAASAGVKLVVCQPRRAFPAAILLKELLSTGWLGRLQSVCWSEGQPYSWPAESLSQLLNEHGGSELFDIGAHAFDMLSWWFGDLRVKEYSDDSRGGTSAEYEVELSGQEVASVRVKLSRLMPLENRLELVGEHAAVTWEFKDFSRFHVRLSGRDHKTSFIVGSAQAGFGMAVAMADQLHQFCNLLQGHPSSSVQSVHALRYARIFDDCRSRQTHVARLEARTTDRAVVTGASGFIGTRLVEALHESGAPVTALARRPQSCARLARLPVDIRLADVTQVDSLDRVLSGGGDVIYHCAVATGGRDIVQDTIVNGTLRLIAAAERHGFRRVVVFSSMLAYGDPPPTGVVNEATSPSSSDQVYSTAKKEMVRQCQLLAPSLKTEIVILEPTCVFGPYGRDFGTAHLDALRNDSFFLFNEGAGLANLIYVDNLVDAALLATNMRCRTGSRFLLNEEEYACSWQEYFTTLAKAAFGQDCVPLPSVSSRELSDILKFRDQQSRFPMVWRNAVRQHRPTQEWLQRNFLFRSWQILKHASNRIGGAQSSAAPQGKNPEMAAGEEFNTLSLRRNRIIREMRNSDRLYITKSVSEFFSSRAIYSSTAFRQATGWMPRVNRDSAIKETISWATRHYQTAKFGLRI